MKLMDLKRSFAVFAGVTLLVGCSHQITESPIVIQNYAANTKLAEAASTTSNSLTELGAVQRAVNPLMIERTLVSPTDPGMSRLASIDWSGPVGPVVQKIAFASGYKLRVLGTPPAIPVLVSLQQTNVPLAYILRDIDFQCANKAKIVILPALQVIELRYAKN